MGKSFNSAMFLLEVSEVVTMPRLTTTSTTKIRYLLYFIYLRIGVIYLLHV